MQLENTLEGKTTDSQDVRLLQLLFDMA